MRASQLIGLSLGFFQLESIQDAPGDIVVSDGLLESGAIIIYWDEVVEEKERLSLGNAGEVVTNAVHQAGSHDSGIREGSLNRLLSDELSLEIQ